MAGSHVCLTVCAEVAASSVPSHFSCDQVIVHPRFTHNHSPTTRPRHSNPPKLKSKNLPQEILPSSQASRRELLLPVGGSTTDLQPKPSVGIKASSISSNPWTRCPNAARLLVRIPVSLSTSWNYITGSVFTPPTELCFGSSERRWRCSRSATSLGTQTICKSDRSGGAVAGRGEQCATEGGQD
jgi:hypothetical protein